MRAYFGHRKCASTWVRELVQGVCREIGIPHYLVMYDRKPDGQRNLEARAKTGSEGERGSFPRGLLRERAEEAGAGFVSCMNADRLQAETLAPERGFHVIRDPRDIIVSGYFSHFHGKAGGHPNPGAWEREHMTRHRERLRAVSKEEGLVLEMDFSRSSLIDMAEWDYERPEMLEMRLEELAPHPYDGFVRIFRHLELLRDDEPSAARELLSLSVRRTLNRLSTRPGLAALCRSMPATGGLLLGSVYGHRFEAKTKGRRAGTEDVASHYRKGVAGDWVHHFTPEVAAAFEERFAGLPQKLGYNGSS
jgi:hypothetical protein